MLFLHSVLNKKLEVIYTSIPENTKKFVEGLGEEEKAALSGIYDGQRMKRWSVEEYLTD